MKSFFLLNSQLTNGWNEILRIDTLASNPGSEVMRSPDSSFYNSVLMKQILLSVRINPGTFSRHSSTRLQSIHLVPPIESILENDTSMRRESLSERWERWKRNLTGRQRSQVPNGCLWHLDSRPPYTKLSRDCQSTQANLSLLKPVSAS